MDIKGRTFIISGGASGLGQATARQLTAAGANVVIVDLNEVAAQAVAKELGETARSQRCDVTREEDGKAAIQTAVDAFGGLHGVVNCAGIAVGEKVVGKGGPHALESFARCIHINTVGSFNLIRLAAARIHEQPELDGGERGVIVNTASVAAFEGQIGQAAYAASKGAIVSMTLPIARELARYGIRVVTIAPGLFETPMMAGMPPQVQESLGKTVPFPSRLGKPAEYAALVEHIVQNPMINGETIRLDGALRMAPR